MKMMRRWADGGASEARKRVAELIRQRVQAFELEGGQWLFQADDRPVDHANYDDPHKPPPRRPIVDDDLDGWEPL